MLDSLRTAWPLAVQNALSRRSNWVIGVLVLLGPLLLVPGQAIINGLERAIVSNFTTTGFGEVVVYSNAAREPFGVSMRGVAPQVPIADFPKVKAALENIPGVKAVVPFGLTETVWFMGGNPLDRALEDLRRGLHAPPEQRAALISRARRLTTLVDQNRRRRAEVGGYALQETTAQDFQRAASAEFWDGFQQAPEAALEFLENRVAPQADGEVVIDTFGGYGTDIDAFMRAFPRTYVVEGTTVPPGRRGILLGTFFYDDRLKLKVARGLDLLKVELTRKGRTLAENPDLQRSVTELQARIYEILYQLDDQRAAAMAKKLQSFLGVADGELSTLLERFLALDDANFAARYDYFYKELAPSLELYRVRIGDTVALKSQGKNGHTQSVLVKVYGTIAFRGLEDSVQGNACLLDLATFRDLYGYPDEREARETAEILKGANIQELSREELERQLGSAPPEPPEPEDAAATGSLEAIRSAAARRAQASEVVDRVYSREELERLEVMAGVVVLKDPGEQKRMLGTVEALAKAQGFQVKVLPGEEVVSFLSAFKHIFNLVLYIIAFIILLAIVIIINNAAVLVAVQRTSEIGMIRAIGGQAQLVVALVVLEMLLVALCFGVVGTVGGAALAVYLERVGIGAPSPELAFVFGGARLFPHFTRADVLIPLLAILPTSMLATSYPALLATRVTPLKAMSTEE